MEDSASRAALSQRGYRAAGKAPRRRTPTVPKERANEANRPRPRVGGSSANPRGRTQSPSAVEPTETGEEARERSQSAGTNSGASRPKEGTVVGPGTSRHPVLSARSKPIRKSTLTPFRRIACFPCTATPQRANEPNSGRAAGGPDHRRGEGRPPTFGRFRARSKPILDLVGPVWEAAATRRKNGANEANFSERGAADYAAARPHTAVCSDGDRTIVPPAPGLDTATSREAAQRARSTSGPPDSAGRSSQRARPATILDARTRRARPA